MSPIACILYSVSAFILGVAVGLKWANHSMIHLMEEMFPEDTQAMNQSIYDQALANGCTPQFAELLASRRVNLVGTDKAFFARIQRFGDERHPEHAANVAAQLQANGVKVDSQTIYFQEMAQFAGDPRAAFRPSDGQAEIVRRCEQMGAHRDLSGGRSSLKFEWGKPDRDPLESAPPIAEDIIQERVQEIVREDPDAKAEGYAKLREKVIKKHGPAKGRKGKLHDIKPAKG